MDIYFHRRLLQFSDYFNFANFVNVIVCRPFSASLSFRFSSLQLFAWPLIEKDDVEYAINVSVCVCVFVAQSTCFSWLAHTSEGGQERRWEGETIQTSFKIKYNCSRDEWWPQHHLSPCAQIILAAFSDIDIGCVCDGRCDYSIFILSFFLPFASSI